MSTSPSWFDQDKFSRLVKKVGAKNAPAPAAPISLRDLKRAAKNPETPARPANRIPSSALAPSVKASRPIQRPKTGALPAVAAPTDPALIPLPAADPAPEAEENATPSFPASVPPPETRSVSPLSRRTTPLPDLKSLFEYDKSPEAGTDSGMVPFPSPVRTPVPAPFDPTEMRAPDLGVDFPGETRSIGPHQIDSKTEMPEPDIDDRDLPVEPPTPLPEEETAAETGETRPGDLALLRSQLSQQDDLVRQRDELASRVNELSTAAQERDDARHEAALLRARLIQAGDPMAVAGADSASTEELARAIEDRDHARRDYALLREQFETMKHEQLRARQEAPRRDPDAQREVELLRAQLAEREEELNSLKIDPMGVDPEIDSLREESDLLQKQLNKAREEASIAQRGLALSQKALQETRDALRESSEGTSQMRASLESLKNEYATLVQQNTLLQAQYDQLTREVSTLRTKSLRSGSKV